MRLITISAAIAATLVSMPRAAFAQAVVPFGDTWRYSTTNGSVDGAALSALDFDDANWVLGSAPFGNHPTVCGTPQTWFGGGTGERLLLRKTFYLPPGSYTDATVTFRFQGSFAHWINGLRVGGVAGRYDCYVQETNGWAFFQPGKNVLFVWLSDHGSGQYIDVEIYVPIATLARFWSFSRLKSAYR